MRVRKRVEYAGSRARESAWALQERLLWPIGDAARKAVSLARRALEPLHRLLQTKLVWPLADRLDDYGIATRTAIATAAVIAAAAATLGGVRLASSGPDGSLSETERIALGTAPAAAPAPELSGVTPDFEQAAAETTTAASEAVPPAPKAPAADAPKPARVAWDFAQAFVRYEVGKADAETASTFASIADKPLAEALSDEPPRLPESAEVPKAEVLNVVLGERDGKEIEVSVSLLRLRAASELRLTLRETRKGWEVIEVRG